jgi:hypothetical protein
MAVRMVKERDHASDGDARPTVHRGRFPVQYSAVLFRRRLTTRRLLFVNRERDKQDVRDRRDSRR